MQVRVSNQTQQVTRELQVEAEAGLDNFCLKHNINGLSRTREWASFRCQRAVWESLHGHWQKVEDVSLQTENHCMVQILPSA